MAKALNYHIFYASALIFMCILIVYYIILAELFEYVQSIMFMGIDEAISSSALSVALSLCGENIILSKALFLLITEKYAICS